jgi:hypothetical protein
MWGFFEKRGEREKARLFTLFISAILNLAFEVSLNGRGYAPPWDGISGVIPGFTRRKTPGGF